MPNPIKYTTGSETLALKKGNMYIGTGAVGKGPSDVTGYYQGPNVPSNGYVIYMNKVGAPGGLSYHSAANDSELISFTNNLAGQSYTSTTQCFDYYYGQTDKVLVNQDYPADFPYIVMDGLVLYLDAGITQSYPGSGTTWSDINGLGPKNNGTLTNSPTFNSGNGGSIVFDGADDYVIISDSNSLTNTTNLSICVWVNFTNKNRVNDIIGKGFGEPDNNEEYTIIQYNDSIYFDVGNAAGPYIQPSYTINNNIWYHIVCTHERINNTSYLKLYVNGVNVPANVNAAQNTPNNNNSPVTLGRRAYDGQPYGNRTLAGKIAITQIYTKTLSEVEVLQNYQASFPRFLGENIVTNGLTMYQDAGYSLSYPTTGTSWYNVSGVSGKTGTLTNGPTYNSANGGSIVFDGVDDYVIIPTSFGNEGSICCWVYPKSTNNNFFTYTNSTGLPTSEASHRLGITTDNKLNAYIWPGSPTNFDGTDFMATNRWHYCVFWWKVGVGYGSYLNGVSQGSGSLNGSPNAGSHLFVGSIWRGSGGYLNGNISILQTYSRVLSQTEITQNYNAQKGRFGL